MTLGPDADHHFQLDIEAEQALIGAALARPEMLGHLAGTLQPAYFAEPLHGQMFDIIRRLQSEGRAPTPVAIETRLGNDIRVGDMSLRAYATEMAKRAIRIPDAHDYAERVRDLWAVRETATIGAQLEESARQQGADPRELIAAASSSLDEVRAALATSRVMARWAGDFASDALDTIDRIRAGEAVEQGATTGLADLDRDLGGLVPGHLVVVAGRPGMGKSITGLSIARQCAKAGNGVVFFSLEMDDKQVRSRLLADEAYSSGRTITFKQIAEGRDLDDDQVDLLRRCAADLQHRPLLLDARTGLTVSDIAARTRAAMDAMRRRGTPLRAIVVDYLKFIQPSGRYRGQRVYEVGEITAGLKALAKDLDVCVVLLAQLNRAVEARPDKRPELGDLRESGDIEADADTVLLLFREAYYLKDAREPEAIEKLLAAENRLDIILAKNRNGPTRTRTVFCNVAANAVRNWAGSYA